MLFNTALHHAFLFKWLLALHIIAVVAWFAGLFYLPRLFVYHHQTQTDEHACLQRLCTMEHKLYYFITWPAGVLASVLGLSLLSFQWDHYAHLNWMHIKLISVIVLWAFHLSLGYFVWAFQKGQRPHNARFFRMYNEVPTLLLCIIIIAVIVRPFSG